MKNLLHKLFSVSMALLLLLSTISWTVEKHMCMGRVMDVALFNEAKDCCMDSNSVVKGSLGIESAHCCNNEAFTMQGQNDLTHDFSKFDFSQQVFLVSFTSTYLGLFEDYVEKKIIFNSYPPLILAEDLNILHQVFLI
ncbi:HYC_CC_PP family protein [Maribacter sp. Asnod1-A12]|uniref:HYC_CC_PP family protein n=1 Tax=Maribacter sp. Asnod1-A12 TaxID=3160576 RepID=UPI00386EA310